MNMNFIKSTKYTVLSGLFIALTVLLSSCEKANDWETDSAYNRLFRSTKLAVSPSINDAEVIWNNTINTDYYIIEVNTSELTAENYQEGSVIFGEDKSIKSSPYTIEGLDANTSYYIRIRSCSETASPSKWVYPENTSFKTKTEQLIEEISTITGSTAIITWKKNQSVTHFLLTNTETSAVTNIPISAEMNAEGSYQLTGLAASTTYTIGIYNTVNGEDVLRGEKSFQTTENFPDGYTPVYLTAADDPNEVLAAQSGKIVFVIPHSTAIDFNEKVTIPSSITSIIFWGASGGEEQATMKIKTITAEGTKDMIRFYNLHIDPQGDYMFNLQDVDADINTVLVENCVVEKSKGVIRAKNGSVVRIGKAAINNCIINGSSAALFAFKESAVAQVPVIELTNSTVMNITQQYFYLINQSQIKVSDCTLYGIGSAKAFLELSNKEADTSMYMENTIIAKGTTTNTIKACNVKNKCTYSKVYVTSDCTFDSTMDGIECSKSDELFVDAENGDFRIKDPLFTANVGDPRWKE